MAPVALSDNLAAVTVLGRVAALLLVGVGWTEEIPLSSAYAICESCVELDDP